MFKGRVSRITPRKNKYRTSWTETYKQDIIEDGSRCSKCGCGNSWKNPLQRHHKIPKSKHGRDIKANIKILCLKCHKKQHEKLKVKKAKIGAP
jgi:RNA-directed DNA polymerase